MEGAVRNHLSFLVVPAVLAVGGAASATPEYPGTIQGKLSLTYTPACTVCHISATGGANTAKKPFAMSLLANGLTGGSNPSSLETALAALEAKNVSSAGDGVSDITKLKNGWDPNSPAPAGAILADGGINADAGGGVAAGGPPGGDAGPAYGCGAHIAPSAERRGLPLVGLVLALAALARRRK